MHYPCKNGVLMVKHDDNFSHSTDDFKVYIPAGTFYDDIPLSYSAQLSENPGLYSKIHQLHNVLVPMHKSAVVQLRGIDIPVEYRSKVVMVHKDLKSVEQTFSTFWKDGMVSARSKEVGSFYVKIDSLAPEIKWLNYTANTKTFRGNQIRIKISDNLSGISDYDGYIDTEWVVFDYDAKRNLLTYDFDKHFLPGEHELKIIVSDDVNNTAEKEIQFTLPKSN